MRANYKSSPSVESGSGLLIVLFFLVLTSLTIGIIFSVTNSHVVASRRTVNRAIAAAYADGVIESLFDQWRQALSTVSNATDRANGMTNTALAAALSPPNSTALPLPAGVTLTSWSVTARTPLLAPTTDPAGRPTLENGTPSSQRVRIYYLASATVQYRGANAPATATVQRYFVRAGRNIFDNFFFGTQSNVEFHPGPDMYVDGTVYVGGNLYTAQNSIHFLNDVTFTGAQILNYRPTDSRYGNTAPTITGAPTNWSSSNPPHVGVQQKLLDAPITSLDPNFVDDSIANDTDSDGNPNNNGYHEIIEQVTDKTKADPLQLDAVDSERLSNNADYRIEVDINNKLTVYSGASTTALATTSSEYKAISGAITLNTALADNREGDNARLITVDVSKINTAATAGKIIDSVGNSDGFLLYINDTSVGSSVKTNVVDSATGTKTAVTSSRLRAVKLINGATLPSAGLTIATPNPVYIQGDYNTGTTSSTQPASNTATSYTPPADTPSPVVGTYTRAPSAVAGDAVNILSNNWNDANSLQGLSSRTASSTTVNTAIVAGNVPTTTSSYSGGIENFTRFHEDWGSAYFTIYGSLALLYDSEQATQPWANASYNPPSRRWYYDTLLQNNNPPGFQVASVYVRGNRVGN